MDMVAINNKRQAEKHKRSALNRLHALLSPRRRIGAGVNPTPNYEQTACGEAYLVPTFQASIWRMRHAKMRRSAGRHTRLPHTFSCNKTSITRCLERSSIKIPADVREPSPRTNA